MFSFATISLLTHPGIRKIRPFWDESAHHTFADTDVGVPNGDWKT